MRLRPEPAHGSTTAALPTHNAHPAIGYRKSQSFPPPPCRATLVAFYLPQFHPTPENDTWWGPGFTEWSNVARAVPQFDGHHQPQIPKDLGFYDLRLPEVMKRQVELAHRYGVGAFCFYYYWFAGKRVLELPLNNYLGTPDLDLPFCLCWANEPWTRRWDGRDQDVLLEQAHSPEDDIAFIASLAPFIRDPRYLRVEGRPLLLLYRAELLPDPKATALRWRGYCREHGLGEIHLACVESFMRHDPAAYGFDSAVEFPPNLTEAAGAQAEVSLLSTEYRGEALDWRAMATQFQSSRHPRYRRFRGVNPMWDNEARRPGGGRSLVFSAPRRYEDWLRSMINAVVEHEPCDDARLVFINAWNEWAEGARLEPDTRLGHAWLEATRRAQFRALAKPGRPCIVVHAYYPDLLDEILLRIERLGTPCRLVITTSHEHGRAVAALVERHGLEAELHLVDNRGRDVLPFLEVADRLIDEGEDLVVKVHTKRSIHLPDGDAWRVELFEQLLSAESVRRIIAAFEGEPRLGLVGPAGHLLDARQHAGANQMQCERLQRLMGIGSSPSPALFFAGTMFWVRLAALRPLLDTHLYPWQFEPELAQTDGTLAHAIERMIPSVVHAAGYWFATAAAPTVRAVRPDTFEYRFVPGSGRR